MVGKVREVVLVRRVGEIVEFGVVRLVGWLTKVEEVGDVREFSSVRLARWVREVELVRCVSLVG